MKKGTLALVSLLALTAGLVIALSSRQPVSQTAQRQPDLSAEPEMLDLAQLRALPATSLVILDVRGPLFYQRGHLPGALSMPKQSFKNRLPESLAQIPKSGSTRIVAYCSDAGCDDALIVARQLIQAGYANVAVFHGGWEEWTQNKLPEQQG